MAEEDPYSYILRKLAKRDLEPPVLFFDDAYCDFLKFCDADYKPCDISWEPSCIFFTASDHPNRWKFKSWSYINCDVYLDHLSERVFLSEFDNARLDALGVDAVFAHLHALFVLFAYTYVLI